MPKARSENRDKAYKLWKSSDGKMMLKDIAATLGVSDTQIRKWKNQDNWDDKNKVTLPITNSNVTKQKKKRGAPKGSKNALGNKGGNGGPPGNDHAVKHGFFSKIFPDDEETREILAEIQLKSPIDMLWENIVIQYTAIARAQKIMFVKNQEDLTKVLKRQKESNGPGSDSWEKEYELQFAWDKHASFMKAQSRAIQTLNQTIERYEKLLLKELDTEEQQLRIGKLKAELEKIKDPSPEEGGVMIVDDIS